MAYKRFFQALKILLIVFSLQLFGVFLVADSKTQPQTPVSRYGQLKVVGTHLCDSKGNQIQLKGMSTGGLQWYGDIVNEAAFTAIAKDWNCEVIRLALYVGESGFYDRPSLKDLVIAGVNLAIKLGMYVVVDWHVLNPGDPNYPVYSGAKAFFTEIAQRYGSKPNIIYEIMNEPNGDVDWEKDLKPYATRMVSTIRAIDPDNVILIGSGTWSQDVDIAAANPVAGSNLMYTVHFYAGTHGATLRAKISAALAKGAAVFCSEWGTSEASGEGGPYFKESDEWLLFLDKNKISWANWSLSNGAASSCALKADSFGYDKDGGAMITSGASLTPDFKGKDGYAIWPIEQLSTSGAYVRKKMRGEK